MIKAKIDKTLKWWWILLDSFYKDPEVQLDSKDHFLRIQKQWDFCAGERIDDGIPTLVFDTIEKIEVKDCIVPKGKGLGLIFSSKLKEILENEGIDNIDYYNILINNKHSKEELEGYYLTNIVETKPFLTDDSMWDDVPSLDLKIIMDIGFNEDFLENQKSKIIRSEKCPTIIAIRGSLKQKLDEEGITGLDTILPEDWHDYFP